MRIPKEIDISGYTLKIQYKNSITINGAECFGVYHQEKKAIWLVKGMPMARKKEIFLHEFIHFLEDIYRIDISEASVASLALGILQLLNNKRIEL